MSSVLFSRARETIQRHKMVVSGDRIAVAVSGGADSVALLRLLHAMRGELGVTLCVVHFNHKLRDSESDADEMFVASLASSLGLPFFSDRSDVAEFARQNHLNLEDAGRRSRYRFFESLLLKQAATRVATAHTADDQAETVLARVIRGTGLSGLASIYPVRGPIIRPLLETRRDELRKYLQSIRQPWREDSSNADTRRLRARIRKDLLPQIEKRYSHAIVGRLTELAELAHSETVFWRSLVEERCNNLVQKSGTICSLGAKELLSPLDCLPPAGIHDERPWRALSQRIVRKLYSDAASSGAELSRKHVAQVLRMAESGSSGQKLQLPGGVQVRREFDRLVFCHSSIAKSRDPLAESAASYAYPIDLPVHGPASVSIPELGRAFYLKVIDWPALERETRQEGVILDTEHLRAPLILRNWKPGDAYCPSGRRRSRKVTRMMMAARIGRSQRALWPVLTSAGRVAWADRLPVAADFSVSEATRTGLWISQDAG